MEHQTKSVRDLLARLFSSVDDRAGRQYVELHHKWQSLVGFDIAAHSEPVDVKRSALVVQVDHPGWMQMLQMREKALIVRLQREFPELSITSLHMKLQTETSAATGFPTDSAPPTAKPSPAQDDEAVPVTPADAAAGIERISDPVLRERLERLGKVIAERNALSEDNGQDNSGGREDNQG